MPIYEYECQKCKAHIEILQKITDKPLAKCRKCGGRLEKQWSQSGFQFKGSGWYVTDYTNKKTGKEEKTGSDAETKSAESKTTEPVAASETTTTKKTTAKKKSSSNSTVKGD